MLHYYISNIKSLLYRTRAAVENLRLYVKTLTIIAIIVFAAGRSSASEPPVKLKSSGQPTAQTAAEVTKGECAIVADITDLRGKYVTSRVELRRNSPESEVVQSVEVPKGQKEFRAPAGQYKAWVYAYYLEVPFLIDVVAVNASPKQPAYIAVELVEGNSDSMPLWKFDQDYDLALDRVELALGTNPSDAGSIPGTSRIPIKNVVFDKKGGWLKGELHCSSNYGHGSETVGQLVKRAEKTGLDFLAITDLNSMQACMDPEFKSSKVLLIPAMAWGDEKRGVALVYAPQTFPRVPKSFNEAQAICRLVQAQGGVFAAAHPLFPDAPWQWSLNELNAVEIWCREYNLVPPLPKERLDEELLLRKKGKLVYSIAKAAARKDLSANGQASHYWDCEMATGSHVAAIAGSRSASPNVPLGKPLTYVYAEEKSTAGVIAGLRLGRTYVSTGVEGPKLFFRADVRGDGTFDVPIIGGVVPLFVETSFEVGVEGALGKKVEVLLDGKPIITKKIEDNSFGLRFKQKPDVYSVYRIRVVEPATGREFAPLDVLAESSPIYAQEMYFGDPSKMRIRIKKNQLPPDALRTDPAPMHDTKGEIIPQKVF
jgi:hypothetical protein